MVGSGGDGGGNKARHRPPQVTPFVFAADARANGKVLSREFGASCSGRGTASHADLIFNAGNALPHV